MSNEEILRSAGFWRRDHLTNQEGYILAVVLLFGKEQTILNYCPWHRTDAIYRNMTRKRFLNPLPTDPDVRYNDRDMVCVNLIESYVRLMNFIERNMPDVFALDERGINRLDLRNMLFREIVSNLLLHREYASTFSSKLLIFSDRVITENWTKPMQTGNVTLDTLETHTKNPLTTKVFREMKWAEELGSGKKNIKKYAPLYYENYEISIQNNEKFVFSITYKSENETLDESEKEPGEHVGTKQEPSRNHTEVKRPSDQATKRPSTAVTKQPSKSQLKPNRKQILDFCHISRDMKEIMSHLGYKHRQNFRLHHIKPMLEEGLLSMTFPENPNHQEQKYITTEKGKELC
jgi:ATP-dependent DNA helicase RecG